MACRKARVGEKSLAAVEELHEKATDLYENVFKGYLTLTGAIKCLTRRENPEYFEDVIGHFCIETDLPCTVLPQLEDLKLTAYRFGVTR